MKKFFPHFTILIFILVTWVIPDNTIAQGKKEHVICIAFYNLENLFDTIDDPKVDDAEFTPSGSDQWDSRRYRNKLTHLAEAISKIGDDSVKTGAPVLVGLAEVENKQVLTDLINTPPLNEMKYKIVHYDSPDKRGIDVALIYQPGMFKVKESKAIPLRIENKDDFFTRDILQVSGTMKGQSLYVLVNHWPSRSKGQSETADFRNAAADLCRESVASILKSDPSADVIVMGDLNDDPTDESVLVHLGTTIDPSNLSPAGIFNPMWRLFNEGKGTLEYKGKWNLFDQIIVSKGLMSDATNQYNFLKAGVFKKEWLLEQDGKYKGTPFRTYAGSKYLGGYSDHLPVYILLKKTK